jgi:hypothetical protein
MAVDLKGGGTGERGEEKRARLGLVGRARVLIWDRWGRTL